MRFLNNNQTKLRRLNKIKKTWKPRIPTPKPGWAMKSKRDYNRSRSRKLEKESIEFSDGDVLFSDCCGSPVIRSYGKDFFGDEEERIATSWYECTSCKKPCNAERF